MEVPYCSVGSDYVHVYVERGFESTYGRLASAAQIQMQTR